MNEAIDFSTLRWVKSELDETLKQARQALEAYVENSDDSAQLDELAAHLHQVFGTLQMVELYGAALLAEEMEQVAIALGKGKITQQTDVFEVLVRSILQLPDYLDRLAAGHRDVPLVLLPLLNDLRALRGENLMSESTMFSPNLDAPLPEQISSLNIEGDISQRARELRHKFQLNLLDFLRDQNTEVSLSALNEISEILTAMSARKDIRTYWWIGSGVIQALMEGSLQTNAALKMLFGRMDQVLRRLIDEGETALSTKETTEMCKNLLFYAGQSKSDNATITEIRATYQLDTLLPSDDEMESAQDSLSGHNTDLFKTVAGVVKEELKHLRSALDVLVREDGSNLDGVKQVAVSLRSMADTLGMLGMGAQRKAILGKSEDLQTGIDQSEAPSETALMEIASTLLLVDSAMSQMEQGRAVKMPETSDDINATLAESEFDQVKDVVLNEALTDLVRAKEAIMEFMDEGDVKLVGEATQLLGQVKGGLLLLDETRASSLLGSAAKYIKQTMTDVINLPPEKDLKALADTICGVEYYLEGLREYRLFGDNAMDMAEQGIAELGYTSEDYKVDQQQIVDDMPVVIEGFDSEFTEAESNADTEPDDEPVAETVVPEEVIEDQVEDKIAADDSVDQSEVDAGQSDNVVNTQYDEEMSEFPILGEETDEEILEIFTEEAEEEIASIGEQLPAWISDPEQTEALETMRRSFHTLKGSGRLVGAMRIGEFAWAFESLLNRVLDKTIAPSPEVHDILTQSHAALPSLVAQMQHGVPLDKPIAWLMSAANALSKSEPIPAINVTEIEEEFVEESIVNEEQEIVADLVDSDTDTADVMDPVLFEIYQAETNTHFAVIDDFVESGSSLANDELVRALHTLHGSAATASVFPIATVSAKLEKFCKLFFDADKQLQDDDVLALMEGRSIMGKLFEQLPAEIQDVGDSEEFLQGLGELYNKASDEIATEESVEAVEIPAQPEAEAEVEITEQSDAQQTNVAVENDPYADIDQELLQIFMEESSEILERSDSALASWQADTANQEALEILQRELHTLKGGARMADLAPAGDLAHALESVIISIVESGSTQPEGLDLIQTAHDRLASEVDRVGQRQAMSDISEIVNQLNSLQMSLSGSDSSIETQEDAAIEDYGDPELVEIFIEEADDILENSEQTLQHWKEDTGNTEYMASLQRELHTLKGGARMADITDIGDLAHGVESLMVMLADGELQSSPATFNLFERSHDRLAGMVSKLRNRQPLKAASDLLEQLDALRNGEAVSEIEQQPVKEEKPSVTESRVQTRDTNELVRVRANLLDDLVNNAGEVSIYRSRLEQQVGASRYNLVEMEQTVLRLRGQLRKLEIETEAQILFRYEKEIDNADDDFDPLEMDRYSNLQQLSRSLMESVADLTSIQNMLENISRESETLLLQQSRVNTELQEGLMRTRMVPFLGLAPRMRRIVRQISDELGKNVELELSGADGEMDRTVIDRVIAPIEHMLRNAVSHGIELPKERKDKGKPEAGTIRIEFERESSDIVLKISDDGAGINLDSVRKKAIDRGLMNADSQLSDNDILQFILEAGFSTAEKVTQVSGRGVGMDVVTTEVKQLGGTLHIASEQGNGTVFTIRLPFSLAINQALMIEVGEDTYAVPLSTVHGITRIDKHDLEKYYADTESRFTYDGVEYEVQHLGSVLGTHKPNFEALQERVPVMLARVGERAVALQVENLLGSREIVVKSVGPQISTVRGVSGATILGDGRVVMILDVSALLRSGATVIAQIEDLMQQPMKTETITVMVVDDSITVRKVTTRLLERNDMQVITAKDGVDAVAKLHETVPDIMLLDIEMPRMDGFELATHVRNEERLKHIPIIMITSRTGDKHRQRAIEIGVNHYLGKPFQEAELLESVRDLLEG